MPTTRRQRYPTELTYAEWEHRSPLLTDATTSAGRPPRSKPSTAHIMLLHMNAMPAGMVLSFFWPRSLTNRVLGNPKISGPGMLDSPEYRKLEFPAANG